MENTPGQPSMSRPNTPNRRHVLACIGSVGLVGCSSDMKPPRPYSVPFDLSKAGHAVNLEIEVTGKDIGVALMLLFRYETYEQRDDLLRKVMNLPENPNKPESATNRRMGWPIPLRVRWRQGELFLFEGLLLTKSAVSMSIDKAGWFRRGIYGRVLSKGKYQIEVTNIEAQPIFNGYRVEINIPGYEKV